LSLALMVEPPLYIPALALLPMASQSVTTKYPFVTLKKREFPGIRKTGIRHGIQTPSLPALALVPMASQSMGSCPSQRVQQLSSRVQGPNGYQAVTG
jgi:hypothetical protein